ncbi:MAG: DUF697 domain-containing protein [Cyanobacteria bacterium P01_H01_bin.153]
MVRKLLLERPILVGGLGLAASLSLLSGLQDLFADSTTVAGLIAAGAGVWWWRRQSPEAKPTAAKPMVLVEREQVEAAISSLKTNLAALQAELESLPSANTAAIIARLEQQRQALLTALDRTELKVAIAGYPRTGKSSLLPFLTERASTDSDASLTLTEVSLTAETDHSATITTLLQQQDAVVYLVTEDLTESVLGDIKLLSHAGQRVILGLNKRDTYLPKDGDTVLEQIQARLQALPYEVTSAAIATSPRPIKVRTYDESGQASDRLETPPPEVESVTAAVTDWLRHEVPYLVAQTVMRQVQQLQRHIQLELNQARRQQALPLVEQLQWTAAATAFASPVPSLDLLATIAINGQLVMDLGRVYQQPLVLDQAKAIAAELARVVVKLGIVEVSSQLLTTALKSHAATFVVGGSVQALSAAYLTRLCGESLMTYFEERALAGQTSTAVSVEAIGQKIQTLLPTTQRTEFLQSLISQGKQKLFPQSAPALTPGHSPALDFPPKPMTTVVTQVETVSSGEPV